MDINYELFTQKVESGGIHVPPEARMLLFALAKLIHAEDILETGYDAGITTRVLALTGARVIGIDDESEYPASKISAKLLLEPYKNVTLIKQDALTYLLNSKENSFDFIFIDDWHKYNHVLNEAIEAKRIIRPGGIIVFHDTNLFDIYKILDEVFDDWERIVDIKCISDFDNKNYGMGIVLKPNAC